MSRHEGERYPLFAEVTRNLEGEGLLPAFSGGVLLALSGGADSVFLACYLADLAKERGFRLCAMHVHHHLRGEEADRDAAFCAALTEELGIPFRLADISVTEAEKQTYGGVEAAARHLRYAALREERESLGLAFIATAHHATDQLETVLFQMLRGGGLSALCGIRPRRDDLVRPLLCLTRQDILDSLAEMGRSYVTDTTNSDIEYRRNYLRTEILPRLLPVAERPERPIARLSEALSHDAELLDSLAEEALSAAREGRGVSRERLRSLPEALRRRVIVRLFCEARSAEDSHIPLEYTHIVTVSRLLVREGASFSLAVPARLLACLEDGVFFFTREGGAPPSLAKTPLGEGKNCLSGDFVVTLTQKGDALLARCSSKFYKIDTTALISSDIISGRLYARARMSGDAYRFRGHTHSLKTLYNERKIPIGARPLLPLLCDDAGILWMPFYPVRENGSKNPE